MCATEVNGTISANRPWRTGFEGRQADVLATIGSWGGQGHPRSSKRVFQGHIPVITCADNRFTATSGDNVDYIFTVQNRSKVSKLRRSLMGGCLVCTSHIVEREDFVVAKGVEFASG